MHFIGLVNVMNLKAGGLGTLGHEQLEWLEDDVKHLKHSTPIVVFAHIPLWFVYPEWGWGTENSAQALAYLKKFGSVTVLNGHIHHKTRYATQTVSSSARGSRVREHSPRTFASGRITGKTDKCVENRAALHTVASSGPIPVG